MKTKIIYIVLFIAGTLAALSFEQNKTVYPIQKIELKYKADYHLFRNEVVQFLNLLKKEDVSSSLLKQQYFKMRAAFKKVEYLWSFLDREYVNKYINGAPLPKVEPNAPDLNVIEPKGLQCIDEALFEQQIDTEELIRLSKELLHYTPQTSAELGIRDQQFFDASKLAIIRLAYISSSGFDVPGSLQPFVDMQASLEALQYGYSEYKSLFVEKEQLTNQIDDIVKLISQTRKELQNQSDFEKLDRVDLIKNYLNPLFQQVVRFHKSSGYETYYEVTNQRLGVNLMAKNLINESLLDKEFFFPFPEDVDSTHIVELGKTLFYDPILSSTISVACASCHDPKKAFTDGVPRSVTHHGKDTVDRNAPGLLNAVYAEKYFSDLRTENLINQIEHVVISAKEMDTNPMDLTKKIMLSEDYKELFLKAFKSPSISYQKVSLALASYVSKLVDFNTEVDQYLLGAKKDISTSVYDGMNIFYGKGQCATCHFGPTYAGLVPPFYLESESEVLGVPTHSDKKIAKADKDIGRYINIKQQADFYKFSHKTTTTRNVKYTAPYMHNGVFKSLEELVNFYNDGGGNGWGFQLEHQTLSSDELNLTDKEKKDLIAFLNALKSDLSRFEAPKSLPSYSGEYAKWNSRKVQ